MFTNPVALHTAEMPAATGPVLAIPSAGDLGSLSLGIPHQKSIYMVLLPNAPSSTQYDYIYEYYIVYSHVHSFELALIVVIYLFFVV